MELMSVRLLLWVDARMVFSWRLEEDNIFMLLT